MGGGGGGRTREEEGGKDKQFAKVYNYVILFCVENKVTCERPSLLSSNLIKSSIPAALLDQYNYRVFRRSFNLFSKIMFPRKRERGGGGGEGEGKSSNRGGS